VSGTTISQGTAEAPATPWATARNVLLGAAFAALGGGAVAASDSLLRDRNPRDLPLTTLLIVYPILGAVFGWLYSRNPHAKGWKRPPGFFAEGPIPPEERDARVGRIARSMWTGFGSGIALGLVASVLDFAWRGWPFLSETLMSSLFFFPYCGALIGLNLGMRPGDPKPSLRNLRFRTRTLMILTAYAAFWLWLVVSTSRASGAARLYHSKSRGAQMTMPVFQKLLDDAVKDMGRKKNAEELRAGRIPDGLTASQKEFLRSLDGTATEAYRKQRYGLIADGEEFQAKIAADNVETYGQIVDFYRTMAEKYEKAAGQPWLPVEPDPPMPGSTPGVPPPTSGAMRPGATAGP
jgi:hypothetical protein